MNDKNLYQRFRDNELPEQIQQELDTIFNQCASYDEGMFKAGFILGRRLVKDKEWKELLGLEVEE